MSGEVDDKKSPSTSQMEGEEQNISAIFQNAMALAMADSGENESTSRDEPNGEDKGESSSGNNEELNFEFLNKLLSEQQHDHDDKEDDGQEAGNDDLARQLTAALHSTSAKDDDKQSATDDNDDGTNDANDGNNEDENEGNDQDLSNIEAVLASLLTSSMEQHDDHAPTSRQQTKTAGSARQTRVTSQPPVSHEGKGGGSTLSIAETLAITRSNMQQKNAAQGPKIDPMLQRKSVFYNSHYSAAAAAHSAQRARSVPQQSSHSVPTTPHQSPPPPSSSVPRSPQPLPQAQHQTKFHVYTPPTIAKKQNSKTNKQQSKKLHKNTTNSADVTIDDSSIDPEIANALASTVSNTSRQNDDQSDGNADDMSNSESNMVAALLLAKQMFGVEEPGQSAESHSDANNRLNAAAAAAGGNSEDEISAETIDAVQAALQALGKSLEREDQTTGSQSSADRDKQRATRAIVRARKKIQNTILTPEDKERIREDNRERKKRWRDSNTGRNKDNDLRTRVNRKANQIYGEENSHAKQQWVQQEYERRRKRRVQKELDSMNGERKKTIGKKKNVVTTTSNNNNIGIRINNTTGEDFVQSHIQSSANNSDQDDNSDELRMIFESLGKSGDVELNEAFNTIAKDSNLLKNLADLFSNDPPSDPSSGNNNNPQQTNKRPAPDAPEEQPGTKKTATVQPSADDDHHIEELAGLISQVVESNKQGSSREEEQQPKPSHIKPPPPVNVPNSAPRPPQYIAAKPQNSSNSPTPEANGTSSRSNSTEKNEDRRVKALGFPPLLTGMAIKR